MSDDVPILHLDGDPIHVKPGPLTDGTKDRIERAVGLTIPDGKTLAVIGLLEKDGGRPLRGGFGVAIRAGDSWKLVIEGSKELDGPASGFVGVVGVF